MKIAFWMAGAVGGISTKPLAFSKRFAWVALALQVANGACKGKAELPEELSEIERKVPDVQSVLLREWLLLQLNVNRSPVLKISGRVIIITVIVISGYYYYYCHYYYCILGAWLQN